MTELNAQHLLDKLAQDLTIYIGANNITKPIFIGIRTGGVWVAKHLQSSLNNKDELGVLDITFYRDDF